MGPARVSVVQPRRTGSVRRFLIACLLLVGTVAVLPGNLLSVNPGGASPGVIINLTGTGFSATAVQNTVTFTPVGGGEARTSLASTVVTVDTASGIRRLGVRVPVGLAVGRVDLKVDNTSTGESSTGTAIDLVTLTLPETGSGFVGAQGQQVRVTGSANARFAAGSTRPAFGAGVTVISTLVESPTSLVATINIAATAAPGARSVSVTTSTQTLLLADAFSVLPAPPPNRSPTANPNGPYTSVIGAAIDFSSAGSSDPDGDTLSFAWTFGDGATSSDPNPSHAYATPGPYTVGLTVLDGKGGNHLVTTTALIAPLANRPPQITSSPVVSATEGQPYSYQVIASDPDGDSLIYAFLTAPMGMSISASGLISWTPTAVQVGAQAVQVQASDGRGGVDLQSYSAQVAGLVRLTGIEVAPPSLRFTTLGATSALTVTGQRSDQSTIDLTAAATGTTYESSNPLAAQVSVDGVVSATGNGSTTITARNSGLSDTSSVVVEIGVLLETLELTPPVITLRTLSATAQTTLRGSFSDGSVRDLTGSVGTTFSIDAPTVASISAGGLVTSLTPGTATLTAHNEGRSATAEVHVVIVAGTAFLRGEVFDDSKGLPLGGASATLLTASGAGLAASASSPADDRGRFGLGTPAGAAIVRVERSGFTSVERIIDAPGDVVTTLLDARLTPVDGRLNLLQSVFGGQASSADGSATLQVPAGSLDGDVALRLTPLSNQGLQGLLPAGWSPIAAVDLQPAGRRFAQAATLRVPHIDTLPAGAALAVALYDVDTHRWVVQAAGRVGDDRRTLSAPIDVTGQLVFVVPDEAPFVPPAAIPGETLAGVTLPIVPGTATASGEVAPRSAPPGDNVRAVGTVVLQPPAPLSSGAVLRARVSEQFDLLDTTRVRPLPFVQDLVLYARPRIGAPGTLATRLPITPTLQFSIQQLSLGQVRLDVSIDESAAEKAIVGAGGATVSDAAGDVLDLPAGALTADVAVGLLPLGAAELSLPVPEGFTLISAVFIDLVGASFTQPAALSITRPDGLDASTQIVVVQIITDGTGGRRYKIIGLGQISGTRVLVQTTLGTLTFEGVLGGGEFAFLRPGQPLGFVAGLVNSTGAAPQALALVTADTAPFAALTGVAGTFIVAGRAGVPTTVSAIEPAGATASGAATLAAMNDVAALTLGLAQTAPAVVATSPGANATVVSLDTSVIVDFSKAIEPASITASSVVLSIGQTPVSVQLVLSANRRRLTITPASPLTGLTVYTLTLTSAIRDASAVALAPFTPRTFTTLDPSKPAALALGVITAELPDEDGLMLIVGAPGAAEGGSAVVATNLRTQETTTVLALADGSFRLRIRAIVGDEIAMTLRDSQGRESTLSVTQSSSSDGTTSIGSAGGTITGSAGRIGRILPRALSSAGLFQLNGAAATALPALPPLFASADRFGLTIDGATFRSLDSLALSEGQNRFAPGTAFAMPFALSGQLTVPPDFLVTASLRFTANATDRDGARRSATGATVVVASGPDVSVAETGFGDQFPTVFLIAPKQAIPTQIVDVSAVAPTARVEFDLPTAFIPQSGDAFILTRFTEADGQSKLSLVDRLTRVEVNGSGRLRTSGRELPGATRAGEYAVIAGQMAFVTGRASGPAAIVSVDGTPFVFETDGANGAFTLPIPAGAPFTLRFVDAATGAALGDVSGQAPQAGGALNLGQPLAPAGGTLTVTAVPDTQSVVDINAPLVFTFSEPLDRARVTANAFVVTDSAGARTFGTVTLSNGDQVVTFVPLRRWKYATHYRFGVTTAVTAASGTRLAQAFTGEFTTFAPKVVGQSDLGIVRDVAVSGSLAVVATSDGAEVLDVARPSEPIAVSGVAFAGGARGVALVNQPVSDRLGQPTPVPLGVVAAGDSATTGVLQSFSLVSPQSPVLIGSTQLTTSPGQSPPANVPGVSGTPNAVVVDANGRAVVSVRDVGVQAVNTGTAIPLDPTNPGGANSARFAGDAVQSALVGDRIAVASPSGLTILNATTLESVATLAVAGGLTSVAGLPSYAFDVNGDGAVDASTEIFDLVVAGDQAGVIQFYRLSGGTLQLLSAVRLPSGSIVGGIALSAAEQVAYIGAGIRGLALVDLRGPASIQPIDDDREGLDDRVLGLISLPGESGRLSLSLVRGMAFLASGNGGLSVLQVLPPRTKFTALMRDPVPGHLGDEEDVLDTRTAFSTDSALTLRLEAVVPDGESVTLAVEEVSTGAKALSFNPSGTTAVVLHSGQNELVATIAAGSSSSLVTFVARDSRGDVLARLSVDLLGPPSGAEFRSVFVAPPAVHLNDVTTQSALAVGGELPDGRVINVTRASEGTRYRVADDAVAGVSPDGLVTATGGGLTRIEVANGQQNVSVSVQNGRPPVLVGLTPAAAQTTLITSTPVALTFSGRYSDGSIRPASEVANTQFASTDIGVVTVDAVGRVTAVGDGIAVVSATNGGFVASFTVAVELRGLSSIDSIDLAPVSSIVRTDLAVVSLKATVNGTGALHGLVVTFRHAGGESRAVTGADGIASATLSGLTTPGQLAITATVEDPASGQTRSDVEVLTVVAGSADVEPNGGLDSAIPLGSARTVPGSLSAGTDTSDTFRLESDAAGTLRLDLELLAGTTADAVVVVIRDADGREISRTPATGTSLAVPLASGASYITIELSGQSASYRLAAKIEQDPIIINTVAPLSGGPGTTVVLQGSGFSAKAFENTVLFRGVRGKLLTATPTRLEVQVPVYAVDGPITVISGARSLVGPNFQVGNAGPLVPSFALRANPAKARYDLLSGAILDVSRLWVDIDATIQRSTVDALAAGVGASIAGLLPSLNRYLFERAGNATLTELRAFSLAVRALPGVLSVFTVDRPQSQVDRSIDAQTSPGAWQNHAAKSAPYSLVNLFAAIDTIRLTAPYQDPSKFHEVKVAIIDSGFDPRLAAEFPGTVTFKAINPTGHLQALGAFDFLGGHGTAVAGIIAGANDGGPSSDATQTSGVLGSLFWRTELGSRASKVRLVVYGCGEPPDANGEIGISNECIKQSLEDIAREGDIDVVNMSFRGVDYATATAAAGCPLENTSYSGASRRCEYYGLLKPLLERTLAVAAAGNDGVVAENTFPARLESDLENVISIGAVAVVDEDRSGEGADERANFQNGERHDVNPAEVDCRGPGLGLVIVPAKASNCGPGVSMAAPGEDFWTSTSTENRIDDFMYFNGTSSAAPLVAGVAGLLQAIRTTPRWLAPAQLKSILIETADDISNKWRSVLHEPMRRLNVLAAVQAVLPGSTHQHIYITDQNPTAPTGTIAALNVDPLTGTVSGVAPVIRLEHTAGGVTVRGSRPTAILADSVGGYWLYALAKTDHQAGDAVFLINTTSLEVEEVIFLNGATLPATPSLIPLEPVHTSLKSSMVLSRNRRLLFVSAGTEIVVIDTIKARVLKNLNEYQWPATFARPIPFAPIDTGALSALVAANGDEVTSLDISPDGRSLYALVSRGSGTGSQNGFLLEIDIELDRDKSPSTPFVDFDVGEFFTMKNNSTGSFPGIDEPSGVAAAPNGEHVYVTNGGIDSFVSIVPGTSAAFLSALKVFAGNMFSTPYIEITAADLAGRDGYTQLLASGNTQVFSVLLGRLDEQIWKFPSELAQSWTPDSPRMSDQLIRKHVNSERPFGMAFKYDGRRALVPLFQTGNFGVLDLTGQTSQPQRAPDGVFQGLVAVTPSLKLDAFLWPAADQEPLLYPTRITYAQNGRFAVAVHTGVHGGAVTILDDDKITSDLTSHLTQPSVPEPNPPGALVPFFAVRPLCDTRTTPDSFDCESNVFTTLTEFAGPDGQTKFERPRDVAIQPFLSLIHPHFGDRVTLESPTFVTWRDVHASNVEVDLRDLGQNSDPSANGSRVGQPIQRPLSQKEKTEKTLKTSITDFYPGFNFPVDDTRFRFIVTIKDASGDTIGRVMTEFVYRQ